MQTLRGKISEFNELLQGNVDDVPIIAFEDDPAISNRNKRPGCPMNLVCAVVSEAASDLLKVQSRNRGAL